VGFCHRPRVPGEGRAITAAGDRAVWTRIEGIDGKPLDLLRAGIRRQHYAPHLHAEFAVGTCTAGVEVIRYRGETHHAGPGSLVLLEPGEPHTGGPATAEGFAYRAMYPRPSLLDQGLHAQPHFPSPVVHDPELALAVRHVHGVLSRGVDSLEAESLLVSLLAAVVDRHAASASPVRAESRSGLLARTVMARLSDQMTDPPTLAELAGEFGLSRYQLLRSFHDALGMPPYAWLAQHRVTHARLLLETGQRAADVAALVGFADQAHLTRWFRRVVGVTPSAYRNSVQDFARRRHRF